MDSKLSVSIIIVSYNTAALTLACIESIKTVVKSCAYEIIVVDNASSDDSVRRIKQSYDDVVLIESEENIGFGRANNLGCQKAGGKYLFFLNSDTVLMNDPFEWFVSFYESHENVGALGGYLVDGKGEYTLSGGTTYSARKYLRIALDGVLRRKNDMELPYLEQPQAVDYVIGADLFVAKSLFERAGGFDSNIFMYFEDVELCARFMRINKVNYVIPGPKIIHLVKSSSISQFSRVYNTASLMYCLKAKMAPVSFRLFQATYFLLKLPLILRVNNLKNECQYIGAIYRYKEYLSK